MSIIYKLFIISMSIITYLVLDWTAAEGLVYLSQSSASFEGAKTSERRQLTPLKENFN